MKDAKWVESEFAKLGINTKTIINNIGDYVVIYFKQVTPNIQKAIELYTIYETSDDSGNGKVQGLTRDQHRFLGKMFGFTPSEIRDFVDDLEEDFNS